MSTALADLHLDLEKALAGHGFRGLSGEAAAELRKRSPQLVQGLDEGKREEKRHYLMFEGTLEEGGQAITRDLPMSSERELSILDEDGVVLVGTPVRPFDILIGRVTPQIAEPDDAQRLLTAIFGERPLVENFSVRVPVGVSGVVVGVEKDRRVSDGGEDLARVAVRLEVNDACAASVEKQRAEYRREKARVVSLVRAAERNERDREALAQKSRKSRRTIARALDSSRIKKVKGKEERLFLVRQLERASWDEAFAMLEALWWPLANAREHELVLAAAGSSEARANADTIRRALELLREEYMLAQAYLTVRAETCDEEGSATGIGSREIGREANAPTTPPVAREFAGASVGELVEALVPEVPQGAIDRLEELIRGAQETPPDDQAGFVAQVNRLMTAQSLRLQVEGEEGLARLTMKEGLIRLAVAGRGQQRFRGKEIRVVRVPEDYGLKSRKPSASPSPTEP